MDPRLTERMMKEGLLPNLARMSSRGGFSKLGTSVPPQSPVAWSNFINGAGPGWHGIFDFIHRHPHEQCKPFYSAADTVAAQGGWEVGEHQLHLDFWPFQHKRRKSSLNGRGSLSGIIWTKWELPQPFTISPLTIHPVLPNMETIAASAAWGLRICWEVMERTNTSARMGLNDHSTKRGASARNSDHRGYGQLQTGRSRE